MLAPHWLVVFNGNVAHFLGLEIVPIVPHIHTNSHILAYICDDCGFYIGIIYCKAA